MLHGGRKLFPDRERIWPAEGGWAERLRIASTGNVETDARAVLDHLASVTEPWLMVYDNAPNPDAVRKWLPVGAVRCIITSRFTEFGDLAPVTRLDQWSEQVTADYLLARAGRDDAAGAARLAKSLGGLPLAAEQAAVFLSTRKGISLDHYAKEIARLIKRRKDAGLAGDYPDTVYAAFAKSLEAIQEMHGGQVALYVLRLCAFLSPDGVDLALLTDEWGHEVLPATLGTAMGDKFAREDALAALTALSLLRQEDGPFGPVLIFHRLLLEVVRDWMGDDARALWGTAAVRLVSVMFPCDNPSRWLLCGRLMLHVAPIEAHAPRAGEAGRALGRVLNKAGFYLSTCGDLVGALALAERSVPPALMRGTSRDELRELAARLSNLGNQYTYLNMLDEAEAVYREVLEIDERLLDPNDPSHAIALFNLGQAHCTRRGVRQGRTALAPSGGDHEGRASRRVGGIWRIAVQARHALQPMGRRLGRGGAARAGAEYATKGLAVIRAALGARHPTTAYTYHSLAWVKADRGDWPGARWRRRAQSMSCARYALRRRPSRRLPRWPRTEAWRQTQSPSACAPCAGSTDWSRRRLPVDFQSSHASG